MPLKGSTGFTPLPALGEEPESQQLIPVVTLIPNRFFDASPTPLISSQVSLEEDRKKKTQDEPGKLDPKCGKTEPEKSGSEASATKQDDTHKGRCASVAEVRPPAALCTPAHPSHLRGVPCTDLLVSSLTCRDKSQSP